MNVLQELVLRAVAQNDSGAFQDTLHLLEPSIEADISDLCNEEEWYLHFYSLYLYAEALLHTGEIDRAHKAASSLRELYQHGNKQFGYSNDAYGLLHLMKGILQLVDPAGDQEVAIDKLSDLLVYDRLKPELTPKAQYYLALADYQDFNVIDAKRKLLAIPSSNSSFLQGQIHELLLNIQERSCLDFKELRRKHQAFIEIGEYDAWIQKLSLNRSGTMLAVMYQDGMLKLLNTDDGTEVAAFTDQMKLFEEEKASEADLMFSPDSRYLAVGLGVGIVKVYDIEERRLHAEYSYPGLDWEQLETNAYYKEYTHVLFSPQGRYLVIVPTAGSYDPQGDDGYPIPEYYRTFYCIEFSSGQLVLQHTYDESKIASIQISPDEQLLAVGLFGANVTVWDISKKEILVDRDDFVWLGLPSKVGVTSTLVFTKDSKRLVYAARNSSVHIIHLDDDHRIDTIALENDRDCCAVCVDSQDNVIFTQYHHYESYSIAKWNSRQQRTELMFIGDRNIVDDIHLDEERDEIWVCSSTHRTNQEIQHGGTDQTI